MNVRTIKGVTIPVRETTIWRYMSYARFEQMMRDNYIYLARLDQFSDFNEGTLTKAMRRRNQADMEKQGATKNIAEVIPWFHQFLNHKYWYASCWNGDETQANLLWRSYGIPKYDDKDQFKVAVKSTIGRLIDSIAHRDLYLGKVNYLDFDNDDPFLGSDGIDSGSLVFIKQREYKGENEIRLAFQDIGSMQGGILANLPETRKGMAIPVDLGVLLDEVYIEAFPVDWDRLGKNKTGSVDREYRASLDETADKRESMIKALLDNMQIGHVPVRFSSIL